MGLDPGTPGSRPGPKASAKPLSHPGIPPSGEFFLLYRILLVDRKVEGPLLGSLFCSMIYVSVFGLVPHCLDDHRGDP